MGFLGMEPGGVDRAGRRCFGSDLVWFFALPITVHIAFMFAFIFLSPLFSCIAVGLVFLYLLGGFFFGVCIFLWLSCMRLSFTSGLFLCFTMALRLCTARVDGARVLRMGFNVLSRYVLAMNMSF